MIIPISIANDSKESNYKQKSSYKQNHLIQLNVLINKLIRKTHIRSQHVDLNEMWHNAANDLKVVLHDTHQVTFRAMSPQTKINKEKGHRDVLKVLTTTRFRASVLNDDLVSL